MPFRVKRIITHPDTKKPLPRVFVQSGKWKGWYKWENQKRRGCNTHTKRLTKSFNKNRIDFSKV